MLLRACETLSFLTILACQCMAYLPESPPVPFVFKEFLYKDTAKNELMYRDYEAACIQSNACSHHGGVYKLRCLQECISPSCYNYLYSSDPLLMDGMTREEVSLIKNIIDKRL